MEEKIKFYDEPIKRFYVTNEAAKVLLLHLEKHLKDQQISSDESVSFSYHNLKIIVDKNSKMLKEKFGFGFE